MDATVPRRGRGVSEVLTHRSSDAIQQFGRGVGFHQELRVRLPLQVEYRGIAHLAGGDDDRQERPDLADCFEYLDPADVGQGDIERCDVISG